MELVKISKNRYINTENISAIKILNDTIFIQDKNNVVTHSDWVFDDFIKPTSLIEFEVIYEIRQEIEKAKSTINNITMDSNLFHDIQRTQNSEQIIKALKDFENVVIEFNDRELLI